MMLLRLCAGGIVFNGDDVFLLMNDKREWILPKGAIRNNEPSRSVAIARVKSETGVDADIVATAGETNYEFYSITRRAPVCNRITWYIMRAQTPDMRIAFEQGFLDGGWFNINDAVERLTYSQDQSLLRIAYDKWREAR